MKKVDPGSDQQCIKISLKYLDGSIIMWTNIYRLFLCVIIKQLCDQSSGSL